MRVLRWIGWAIWIWLVCVFFALVALGFTVAVIQALVFLFTRFN